MKFGSFSYLLHVLLSAELIVQASSRPTPGVGGGASHCASLPSMRYHVEHLHHQYKLHKNSIDAQLRESVLTSASGLESLSHIPHNAEYFHTFKVNQSLSEMYLHAQSVMLHMDWLKTAEENFSLASHSAGHAVPHLRHLSNIIRATLQQMSEETPEPSSPSPPSLPAVPTAFDVLRFSVEVFEHLKHFCTWSKRVLLHLGTQCRRR